jgi:aminoglycoside phosphotransferase family enzyme/predicted kinase
MSSGESAHQQHEDLFPVMLQALQQPQAFAAPITQNEISLIQTHASAVILTSELVYKLKKPRNFGFFDYSTSSLRRHFCQQEVTLNAPLAPEVYLGLMTVIQTADQQIHFGPLYDALAVPEPGTADQDGTVIDYAVVMKRLPEERTLLSLLNTEEVTPALMHEVARTVAHFHTTTPTSEHIEQFGRMETIRHNWEENFEQMRPYIGQTLTQETFDTIEHYIRQFMEQRTALFEQRLQQGHVRDCHGDLRLQHVYILPENQQTTSSRFLILDRIEFNERFRYGDTASEVAFLAMELEDANRSDLAQIFIEQYAAETHDETLQEVLPFYACYRACVRGKVTSFQLDDPSISEKQRTQAKQEASALFELAVRYTSPNARPTLLLVGGIMGTGKSTIARSLHHHLGWSLSSSDIIRKQLANLDTAKPQTDEFGMGIYNPAWTKQTYATLEREALTMLQQGRSAILDATFIRRGDRQQIAATAIEHGANVVFVECTCPRDITLTRLAQRWRIRAQHEATAQQEASAASDGRPDLYDTQRSRWEAFDPAAEPHVSHYTLTTTEPVQVTTEQVLTELQVPHFHCRLTPKVYGI